MIPTMIMMIMRIRWFYNMPSFHHLLIAHIFNLFFEDASCNGYRVRDSLMANASLVIRHSVEGCLLWGIPELE